jgi:hypothetical protein
MDPSHILVESFAKSVFDFVDAACDVWKDDVELEKSKAKLAEGSYPHAAAMYDELVKQKVHFPKLLAGDESVLEDMKDVEFVVRFKVQEKYDSAHPEVRETCWTYVKQIVQSASMASLYDKCPKSMLTQVSTLANSMVASLADGTFDFAKLNPKELTDQLLATVDQDEVKEWASQVSSDNSMANITNMFSGGGGAEMLQRMAGGMTGANLPPGIANLLSPEMIQTMMQSMMPPNGKL